MSSAAAPSPPVTSRYELVEVLGSGSMGVVYHARDRELGREVALKTLHAPDPETLYALKHEFRSLADLVRPNLVQLYDLVATDEHCFFTMEWIRGCDLRERFLGAEGRPSGEWEALRHALVQLLEGLQALHEQGKLHRDVKPSNVLVESSGRVVLVDFGLVIGMDRLLSLASQRDGFAGTLAYTAPEQAWGQPIGPAADLYGVGVVLYECLTGHLPFEGLGLGAILGRENREPLPPHRWVEDLPPALEALALDLLAHAPAERPSLAEALERLKGGAAGAPPRRPAPRRTPLVGRAAELEALRGAERATRAGRAAAVRIVGASGVGKTTLVEAFLSEAERQEGVLVLRSRCHPQQTVRFEAIDGLVDDLSSFLAREGERARAYLPAGVRPLLRVFPVLARASVELPGREPELADADPQEIRRRAFAALRELLARIAVRRPLIVWIDDLHWGDLDSVPFLRDLLRPPDPPPLLLVMTHRAEDAGRSTILRSLEEDPAYPVQVIELGPLDAEQSEALMRRLLDVSEATLAPEAHALLAEAGGSPFFVGEIARSLAGRAPGPTATALRLSSVIGERIDPLDADARAVLELVAVSQRPIDLQLVLELAGPGGRGLPRVYQLCSSSLLRVASGGELDVYHGRIRDAVLGGLGPDARRARHREIAEGLVGRGADPGVVLDHYLGAGEEGRAAPYALQAAERAREGLAFDRAAELFELAVRLRGRPQQDVALIERRAACLAAAGRGAQAARVYREAAEVAGPGGVRRAALLGHAAEQHFYAAELEAGTALLRDVLRHLHVRLPRSPREASATAALGFAGLVVRGTRLTLRPIETIPPDTLERLDTMLGVVRGTSMLDHTLSLALMGGHLRESLAVGERSRALRALGMEAGTEASVGGPWLRRRSLRLLEQVDELARGSEDPFDHAWAAFCRSNVGWFHGAWRDCVEHGERAVEILRTRCIGISWELAVSAGFTLSALAQLGELRRLATRLPELLADARTRSDGYALTVYRTGDSVLVALAADDPDRALAEMEETGAGWSEGDFHSLHFQHLYGTVHALLYRGDGREASSRMERAWPALRRAGFLLPDCIGNGLRHLRGRAALAAAAETADAAERRGLAALARREARRIARSSLPHAPALTAALRAGAAAAAGDGADCALELERAAEAFAASGMRLYEESARWQLGRLRAGSEGEALRGRAQGWLRSEGARDPEALVRLSVPLGALADF